MSFTNIGVIAMFSVGLLCIALTFIGLLLKTLCSAANDYKTCSCINLLFHLGWMVGWFTMILFFILALILFPLGMIGADGCDFIKKT